MWNNPETEKQKYFNIAFESFEVIHIFYTLQRPSSSLISLV